MAVTGDSGCQELGHTPAGQVKGAAKCELLQPEVQYLGHIVCKDGIATKPKVVAVRGWPTPSKIKQTSRLAPAQVECQFGILTNWAGTAINYDRGTVKDRQKSILSLHKPIILPSSQQFTKNYHYIQDIRHL